MKKLKDYYSEIGYLNMSIENDHKIIIKFQFNSKFQYKMPPNYNFSEINLNYFNLYLDLINLIIDRLNFDTITFLEDSNSILFLKEYPLNRLNLKEAHEFFNDIIYVIEILKEIDNEYLIYNEVFFFNLWNNL